MKERKYFFKNSEGIRLCGVLTESENKTKTCIILCHGITVDKDEDGVFSSLAKKLCGVGFTVFRFDFRGHGESGGKSVDLTVTGEERDLEAAVCFLKSQGYSKFGILAASFGGGAVSLFVSKNKIAKTLVFWNPLLKYSDWMNKKLKKSYFAKKKILKLEDVDFVEIGSRKFRVGKNLFKELKKLNTLQYLRKAGVPIFFIHGTRDSHVPYIDSVEYSKILGAEILLIKGAEHGFHDSRKHAEEAENATIDFFKKNL